MLSPVLFNESWFLFPQQIHAGNTLFGTAALVNHIWQSSLCAGLAWLLTLALRNHSARARYWIWLAASIKFLIPFSLFVAAGQWIRSLSGAAITVRPVSAMMEQIAQPFPQTQLFLGSTGAPVSTSTNFWTPMLLGLWACGSLIVALNWFSKWRRIRNAAQSASPCNVVLAVPVLTSASLLEPGVFGILRPVLLLPDGILDRLSLAQWEAIVAHEMCHVRRRDNLTFALHMLCETLFWFNPLVWWIRARLVEERELACDEAVLASGNDAEVYAEGILSVCKFYVESPVACVAGVSGSELKLRIFRIMNSNVTRCLSPRSKALLSAALFCVLAVPTAVGIFNGEQTAVLAHAQDAPADLPRYEVATIKPNHANDNRIGMRFSPDGVEMNGVPLDRMLRTAFNVEGDRLIGEPNWVKTERWDIQAKVAPEDAPKLDKFTREQRVMMLQSLIVERFGLKFHHETRELPLYTLVIAKGGSKLQPSAAVPQGQDTHRPHSTMFMGQGTLEGKGSSTGDIAHVLSSQVGRTILDKTGLTGEFDYTLRWTPDDAPPPGSGPGGNGPGGSGSGPDAGPADASAPSLFTAVQEQLGLKLESQKGPVDVIVIDHIEQPSAN